MISKLHFGLLISLFALAARADDQPLQFITTAELSARTKAGPPSAWDFTVVDARTRVEYGEGHVAGAVNCPTSEVPARLPKMIKDRARQLVFYCNGPKCTKSQKAARAAIALGYKNVLEYNEGLPAWGKAGLPIEGTPLPAFEAPAVSPEQLAAMSASGHPPVVIDVRDAVEFDAFHVFGSINVPLDSLQARLKELPRGREIVVVCHAGHQSPIAVRVLHHLGRSDLKRLDGGVIAWQQKGLRTVSGTLGHN
jgi:rhodanese-related sulfurtransferase